MNLLGTNSLHLSEFLPPLLAWLFFRAARLSEDRQTLLEFARSRHRKRRRRRELRTRLIPEVSPTPRRALPTNHRSKKGYNVRGTSGSRELRRRRGTSCSCCDRTVSRLPLDETEPFYPGVDGCDHGHSSSDASVIACASVE